MAPSRSIAALTFLNVATLVLLFTTTILARELKQRGNRECNPISTQMRSKGFLYPWWNTTSDEIADESQANSCPSTGSGASRSGKCCKTFDNPVSRNDTQHMFNNKWLGPRLENQAKVFNDSKTKFDVTFKALLSRAHQSFHAMFEKTYGLLYIEHAHVFHELFQTFNAYFDAGRGSLEDKLNQFFAILTRKMFEVLNSQYDFNDSYLSCAAIVIGEKQGNDLHRQIVSSLRRSFVATRALSQGLNDGFEVLSSLQKLEAPSDCLLSLSQMLQCPICLELRAYKPCIQLCTKVSTGCLSSTTMLNRPWLDFVSAVEGIIDRLLGPYNVEAVVEPIHIKISEAIMNFQESGPDLSQSVFGKCGKPRLKSRGRREALPIPRGPAMLKEDDDEGPKPVELKTRPAQSGKGKGKGRHGSDRGRGEDDDDDNDGDDSPNQPSKSLEKFLRDTKKKVQKTKNLWEKLPQQFCNGIIKDFSSQLCWNGTALIKPDKTNKTEETTSKSPLAAVPTSKGSANRQVAEQLLALQIITSKLRDAFNGMDVKWVEDKASNDDMEFGSGQGSGSGEGPSDLDDSDDDDPSGIRPGMGRKPEYNPPPYFGGTPPAIFNPRPKLVPEDSSEEDDHDHILKHGNLPGSTTYDNPPRIKPDVVFGGGEGPDNVFPPETTYPERPSHPGTIDGTRKVPTSGSSADVTSKTVAVFKVFTPIFVSMLGKLVSLS